MIYVTKIELKKVKTITRFIVTVLFDKLKPKASDAVTDIPTAREIINLINISIIFYDLTIFLITDSTNNLNAGLFSLS